MSGLIIKIDNKRSFATDSLLWLRIVIIIQIVFILCLISFIFVQYIQEPEPIYFSLKQNDSLISFAPLEQPMLTDAELLNWVTEAMIVAFSFNYHNYYQVIRKIDEYFDLSGIDSYLNIIANNAALQQIVNKRLILSGRPTAAPRIIKDGIVDGRYAWQIELPFSFRLNNQGVKSNSNYTIGILVVRMSEKKAPVGVKIVNIKIIK